MDIYKLYKCMRYDIFGVRVLVTLSHWCRRQDEPTLGYSRTLYGRRQLGPVDLPLREHRRGEQVGCGRQAAVA